MISGLLGLLLNVFSVALLSAVVIILLFSLVLTTEIWNRFNLSAQDKQSVLWLLALAPWAVGALATIIVFTFSSSNLPILLNIDLIHWHHLNEFYIGSWHGFLVFTMIVLGVVMLTQVVRKVIAVNQAAELLSQFAKGRPDGMMELDSDAYSAFTAGIKDPQCYITRALLLELDPLEYKIIHYHEMSHVRSRDPLRKAWFQILAGFYPSVISRFLLSQMVTAIEQIADSRVVKDCPDKAMIARTLLKVQRLTMRSPHCGSQLANAFHFGAESIEQRINYLLSDSKTKPLSYSVVIVIASILALGFALGADSLHHAIEMTLQHSH